MYNIILLLTIFPKIKRKGGAGVSLDRNTPKGNEINKGWGMRGPPPIIDYPYANKIGRVKKKKGGPQIHNIQIMLLVFFSNIFRGT